MHFDAEGWVVTDAGDPACEKYPTVRTTKLAVPKAGGLVWHYTGGRGSHGTHADCEALAKSIQTYVRGKDRPASWHFLIDKDGTLLQSVPILLGSWHVGQPGRIDGTYFNNINQATIGVELENAGRLEQLDGRFYTWPYYMDPDAPIGQRRANPKLEIEAARARRVAPGSYHDHSTDNAWFDSFDAEQVATAEKLLRALALQNDWEADQCAYGHYMFANGVKEDPGPLWALVLPGLLERAFQR